MTQDNECSISVTAATIRKNEDTFSHPWNPDSQLIGTRLSDLCGLERTDFSLVRIVTGKESFPTNASTQSRVALYFVGQRYCRNGWRRVCRQRRRCPGVPNAISYTSSAQSIGWRFGLAHGWRMSATRNRRFSAARKAHGKIGQTYTNLRSCGW